MSFVVIWLFCGIVAAIVASSKGRSGCAWFVLGILLGPFSFAVAIMPSKAAQHVRQESSGWVDKSDFKKCPYCAEDVRKEAIKCRHCGSDIAPEKNDGPRIPCPDGRCVGIINEEGVCGRCGAPADDGRSSLAYKAGKACAKLTRS